MCRLVHVKSFCADWGVLLDSCKIGVDFALKVLNWDNNTTIRLQLWDIAGQYMCWRGSACVIEGQCMFQRGLVFVLERVSVCVREDQCV